MATNSSAIQKKIETLKKGLNNKFITAAQKEKIKAQVQKLESQSKASSPKKTTKPAASSSLTRLQKLVKNKKYGVYKGAGVDLKKDSDRPAKAIGKRISKSGKTYYEYRANRIDVKQPPKKYPKLEKGGYMAKGGETDDVFFDKKSDVKFKFSPNEHIKVLQYDNGKLKKLGATIFEQFAAEQNDGTFYPFYYVIGDWQKPDEDGKKYPLLYSEGELINRHGNKPKKMEQGGYMAKGGVIGSYELMPFISTGVNAMVTPFYQGKESFEGTKDDAIKKANSMLSDKILMVQVNKINPKATNSLNRTKTIETVSRRQDSLAKKRLEELRKELRAERISYAELVELESLSEYIDKDDVELRQAAGLPEHEEDEYKKGGYMADGGRVKGRNNETGETYGVVIGSVKKSDEDIEGGTEMNVRKGYSSRISEVKLVFDKNGNLYEITDYGYGLEGNYPDTSRGSGRNYNADKKETLEVLSKKYNPAFAKKLIELAKNPKMAEGGMTEHGLRIGDKITTDMFWDNQIVVENTKTNKRAQIDLDTGKRKDEMEKGGYMAKGGDISVYNLRKGDKVKTRKGDIETIIRKTGSGSYETIESEYTHSPESLEFVSRPSRKMEDGGVTEKEVVESNAEMVLSKIKEVHHHADELGNVVSAKSNIEAWVVAKIERASTDLSDITHYLEGNKDKMSMGGTVRYYAHKMDKK